MFFFFLFVLFHIVLGFIAERLVFATGIYRFRPAKTTLKYQLGCRPG